MKFLAILLFAGLAHQGSLCPLYECATGLSDAMAEFPTDPDTYLPIIAADECKTLVDTKIQCAKDAMAADVCACDAGTIAWWQDYVKKRGRFDMDLYCAESTGQCFDPEATMCIDAVIAVQTAAHPQPTTRGEKPKRTISADMTETLDKATACLEKSNRGDINRHGCGWRSYLLSNDASYFRNSNAMRLDGCSEPLDDYETCVYPDEGNEAVCGDTTPLHAYFDCQLEIINSNPACRDSPNTPHTRDEFIDMVVEERKGTCGPRKEAQRLLEGCQTKREKVPKEKVPKEKVPKEKVPKEKVIKQRLFDLLKKALQ